MSYDPLRQGSDSQLKMNPFAMNFKFLSLAGENTNEIGQSKQLTTELTFASKFKFAATPKCLQETNTILGENLSTADGNHTEPLTQEQLLTATSNSAAPSERPLAKSSQGTGMERVELVKKTFASKFKFAEEQNATYMPKDITQTGIEGLHSKSAIQKQAFTEILKSGCNFESKLNFMEGKSTDSKKKLSTSHEHVSLLERCRFHERGKEKVRKVIAALAKKSSEPYGPKLLLEANKVIKVIEAMPCNGKTLLQYFLYTIRFLKDMSKKEYPEAKKTVDVLQRYKIVNYQHYARMPKDDKKPSLKRTALVNSHKDLFERNLLQLKDAMAKMKKPITIGRSSALSRDWMRITGFLTLWLEEEIGFGCCHKMFSRDALFKATPTPGNHLYEISFKGPKGILKKAMTARLHQCLIHYSCIRSWRLPRNSHFLIGINGQPFLAKNQERYVPQVTPLCFFMSLPVAMSSTEIYLCYHHEKELEANGYLLINPPQQWKQLLGQEKLDGFLNFSFKPEKIEYKPNDDESGCAFDVSSTQNVVTVSAFSQREYPCTEYKSFFSHLGQYSAEFGVAIKGENLFPDNLEVWNLSRLGDPMSSVQRENKELPGITSPLVHIGALGPCSALQTESANLYTITFVHQGLPTEWTVFPSSEKHKIDELYPQIAPGHRCAFNELERHQVGFINPFGPQVSGLRMSTFTQTAGQFVIISPGAYHQRFSRGFNIVSSISFGAKDWMIQVPDCTLCPGHRSEENSENEQPVSLGSGSGTPGSSLEDDSNNKQHVSQGSGSATSGPGTSGAEPTSPEDKGSRKKQNKSDLDLKSQSESEDCYEFKSFDDPKPRPGRGRPRDPKKLENSATRPTKMCPKCRTICDKNFDRHLNLHFDAETSLGRREKEKVKEEATRRTVQGIRDSQMDLLPKTFSEQLKSNPLIRYQFTEFLDNIGVAYPKEDQERPQKRKMEEVVEEIDETEGSDAQRPEKSARKRLQEMGYPSLDENKSIVRALVNYSTGGHRRSLQVKNALCQIRRILGYVEYMVGTQDSHGWTLLLHTDRMKEYVQMVSEIGGATASTTKNYVDKALTIMKMVPDVFYEADGMPSDTNEHKKYMDALKKATSIMADFGLRKTEEKDRELASRKCALGENLPDVAAWEEYILDSDNVSQFGEQLKALESASDEEIQQLGKKPDESHLREAFNQVVEFMATRQLFLAARPGEISKCTFAEINSPSLFRDTLHISVASHKTGRIKQATIAIEKEHQMDFLRYVAVLKRFKPPPAYGFPFLSPTKGFVEHTKIYRRLNVWLEKNGRERFTCTKLRKTVETTVDLYGSTHDKELVATGLNHSPHTVKKYYRVQTSEKAAAEKAAIKKATAEAKLRALLVKLPPAFPVNIFEGPWNREKLTEWARRETKTDDLVMNDGLFSNYMTSWREAAKPLMVAECRRTLSSGTSTLEEIKQVLQTPVFETVQFDILAELQELRVRLPRIKIHNQSQGE
ncbi:uncharacterized protein LOC117647906 [Thrips palmi]|uniref:Uncharacterized protein LOC117647906 n=1 Tax=Thrips palmi TaxID=161013 RepID=A0A6P8Z6Y4_THRPL|nr:uncharacterized protein LOC117647906 [Thrips palmi]